MLGHLHFPLCKRVAPVFFLDFYIFSVFISFRSSFFSGFPASLLSYCEFLRWNFKKKQLRNRKTHKLLKCFGFSLKKKKSQPNSPFRCGRADHSGSADGRLRGRRGALSPWQPDGGQHHLGHRRRRRAAGNNPEKVFYENTQQDNEGQSWKTTPWAVTGVCAFADGGVCPAAHQRRRHQGLARHSEDVRPPELEGGAGRRHDLRSARGVFVSLRWVRLKASPAPPRPALCLQRSVSSTQTSSAADWRRRRTLSWNLRPVCATSAPEMWRSWFPAGPERRLDTVLCLCRFVYVWWAESSSQLHPPHLQTLSSTVVSLEPSNTLSSSSLWHLCVFETHEWTFQGWWTNISSNEALIVGLDSSGICLWKFENPAVLIVFYNTRKKHVDRLRCPAGSDVWP